MDGFPRTIELVGKWWTGAVRLAIAAGTERFGEIWSTVPGLSDRLLSQRLKELETHGLVTRTVEPTTPTRRGRELVQALQPLV